MNRTLKLSLMIVVVLALGVGKTVLADEPPHQVYFPLVMRAPNTTPNTTPVQVSAAEREIMELLNQTRVEHGVEALTLQSELVTAARRHSLDMATHDFVAHVGSDGTRAGDRMTDAGYEWRTWGEIIGAGFGGDPQLVLDGWLRSPAHRELLLRVTFEDFGVGYVEDPGSTWGYYWTVVFGVRQ